LADPEISQVTKELRFGDKETRVQAAKKLASLGRRAQPAVKALVEALKDRDPLVRFYSVCALGNLGVDAKIAVEPLINGFKSEKEPTILAAIRNALIRIGKPAIPALLTEAKKRESVMAVPAIGILGRMGPEARTAIPVLTDLLQDHKAYFAAASSLVQIDPNHDKAINTLLEIMQDPRETDRNFQAATLLSRTPKKKAVVEFLVALMKETQLKSTKLRNIGELMEEIGPDAKPAVPFLIQQLKAMDPIDDSVVFPASAVLTIDPKETTARTILRRQLTHLTSLAGRGYVPAIHTLARLGKDATPAIPVLEKLLKEPDSTLREAAHKAIQAIRGEREKRLDNGVSHEKWIRAKLYSVCSYSAEETYPSPITRNLKCSTISFATSVTSTGGPRSSHP
jgi:HEAT repeat protein